MTQLQLELIIVAATLFTACGPDSSKGSNLLDMTTEKPSEMTTEKPSDMTSVLTLDEPCQDLVATLYLNCKPTENPGVIGTQQCGIGDVKRWANCSLLGRNSQTDGMSPKVSGYYKENGSNTTITITRTKEGTSVTRVTGISSFMLPNQQEIESTLAGKNSGEFSIYSALKKTISNSPDCYDIELSAFSGIADPVNKCPPPGKNFIKNAQVHYLFVRRICGLQQNSLKGQIPGETSEKYFRDLERTNDSAYDPICP